MRFLIIASIFIAATAHARKIPVLRNGDQKELRVVGCDPGMLPYIDVVGPDKEDRAKKVLSVECAYTRCRFEYSVLQFQDGDLKPVSATGKIYFDYYLKDRTRPTEFLQNIHTMAIDANGISVPVPATRTEVQAQAKALINKKACNEVYEDLADKSHSMMD